MVYVELWDSLTMEIQCFMYVTLWTIGLTYVVIISFLCIGMPADNWYGYLPSTLVPTYADLGLIGAKIKAQNFQ